MKIDRGYNYIRICLFFKRKEFVWDVRTLPLIGSSKCYRYILSTIPHNALLSVLLEKNNRY